MNQFSQLSDLAQTIHLPNDLRDKFAKLRHGVDYTQNPREHGGFGDGSIDAATWTAARDAAAAFEALDRALDRLLDQTIPF